jgi:hypothetical protein
VRRRHGDIGLGPDLTLVIGIFAGAYLHEPVRDEVTRLAVEEVGIAWAHDVRCRRRRCSIAQA